MITIIISIYYSYSYQYSYACSFKHNFLRKRIATNNYFTNKIKFLKMIIGTSGFRDCWHFWISKLLTLLDFEIVDTSGFRNYWHFWVSRMLTLLDLEVRILMKKTRRIHFKHPRSLKPQKYFLTILNKKSSVLFNFSSTIRIGTSIGAFYTVFYGEKDVNNLVCPKAMDIFRILILFVK